MIELIIFVLIIALVGFIAYDYYHCHHIPDGDVACKKRFWRWWLTKEKYRKPRTTFHSRNAPISLAPLQNLCVLKVNSLIAQIRAIDPRAKFTIMDDVSDDECQKYLNYLNRILSELQNKGGIFKGGPVKDSQAYTPFSQNAPATKFTYQPRNSRFV